MAAAVVATVAVVVDVTVSSASELPAVAPQRHAILPTTDLRSRVESGRTRTQTWMWPPPGGGDAAAIFDRSLGGGGGGSRLAATIQRKFKF